MSPALQFIISISATETAVNSDQLRFIERFVDDGINYGDCCSSWSRTAAAVGAVVVAAGAAGAAGAGAVAVAAVGARFCSYVSRESDGGV